MAGSEASTAEADMLYANSVAAFDLLVKDEANRRLRCSKLVLENRIDLFRDKLWEENEQVVAAKKDAEAWRISAEELQNSLDRSQREARSRTRDFDILKTELSSLQDTSADSAHILSEKLALMREISTLKPEIDHLRSQANSHAGLLADKLSLQQQLITLQTELDAERRLHKISQVQYGNQDDQRAELDAQLGRLKEENRKARRQLAEKEENNASNEVHLIKDLRKQLAKEMKDRDAAERRYAQSEAQRESQKTVLNEKVEQYRTKLKATKDKLREAENSTREASNEHDTELPTTKSRAKKAPKRPANSMQADDAAVTPGDVAQSKRAKRAPSVFGEKSTFSVTPFLSRTTSVAPMSPVTQREPEALENADNENSPTTLKLSQAVEWISPTSRPSAILMPSSVGKSNPKVAPPDRRTTAKTLGNLETVAEEQCKGLEIALNEQIDARQNDSSPRTLKSSFAPRALSTFASFKERPLPPQQQKKGRKLFGGVMKTLFDDNQDEEPPQLASSRTAGLQRAFGGLVMSKKSSAVRSLGLTKKGPLMVTDDGFAFSPLKKDRKAKATTNEPS